MSGRLTVGGNGSVEFKEDDGIDYAAVTVQLPGGERVPFLFTVKQLDAKGTVDSFSGDFTVPSYRGSSFLDPKVRRCLRARCCCWGPPGGCRGRLVSRTGASASLPLEAWRLRAREAVQGE
jgi:hypothetical protein